MKTNNHKDRIKALLKGIETGDEASVEVVNEAKYIQHNPQTHEGSEGLAALFKRLSKTSPRVNIVRAFEDGDYVFAHTEYDFDHSNIGFEIFRFEDGQAVEHWDNIQHRKGPNSSGHSMVDGPCEVSDPQSTEANRSLVELFVDSILISRQLDKLDQFVDPQSFIEHSPLSEDGIESLKLKLSQKTGLEFSHCYRTKHKILAEGDFVLCVCEGSNNAIHTSFFDLYRLRDKRIVEHWDTVEAIPPRSEWKNNNGKF
ncbi:MAG: nuclear transport factor 2 family protein [Pseudomonadota bacterium]